MYKLCSKKNVSYIYISLQWRSFTFSLSQNACSDYNVNVSVKCCAKKLRLCLYISQKGAVLHVWQRSSQFRTNLLQPLSYVVSVMLALLCSVPVTLHSSHNNQFLIHRIRRSGKFENISLGGKSWLWLKKLKHFWNAKIICRRIKPLNGYFSKNHKIHRSIKNRVFRWKF